MDIKGIRQRSENTYQFTVSCGFDGNGKHIRNTMTYKVPAGTTPSKVEKVVSQAFLEFEAKCKGTPFFKSSMRFGELVDIYLKEYGTNILKPVTKYNYERDLEIHILPVFGNKKANSITTAELTSFFTQLNKSSETTRKLKTVMSSVFSYGKTQGYISQNPCIGALYKKDAEEIKKVQFLDVDQCKTLIKAIKEYSIVNTILQFALFSGARIGECLGLTWDCVDFQNNTVTIVNNLCFAYGKWFISSTKTKSGTRTIKMSQHIMDLLRVHKQHQDESKKVVGRAWAQPRVVFTSPTGNFYDRTYVNKYLKAVCVSIGLPPISVHKLRHTHISLLINSGFSAKAISERAGHKSTGITTDIYSHIFESYEARMAESLETNLL